MYFAKRYILYNTLTNTFMMIFNKKIFFFYWFILVVFTPQSNFPIKRDRVSENP